VVENTGNWGKLDGIESFNSVSDSIRSNISLSRKLLKKGALITCLISLSITILLFSHILEATVTIKLSVNP